MGGSLIWKMNKNHCKDNYFYTKNKFFEKKFEKHLTSEKNIRIFAVLKATQLRHPLSVFNNL
jgi:hypothetical protein